MPPPIHLNRLDIQVSTGMLIILTEKWAWALWSCDSFHFYLERGWPLH